MSDLVWVGNALYPRWLILAGLAFTAATAIGLIYALQMFVRHLLQRDGEVL